MKKRILLLVLIALLLVGCGLNMKNVDVRFYYPREEYGYNLKDGVIAYEVRSNGGIASSAELLNIYLQGPAEEGFRNPFPADLSVLSLYTLDDTVYIAVSDSLAELSGAKLILTCACIGRTAMDLTGTTNAQIQCEKLLLDGKNVITINENTVFYNDTFHQAPSEEP
jgi:hypothetical protein